MENGKVKEREQHREEIRELEARKYLSIYDTVKLERLRRELKEMEAMS